MSRWRGRPRAPGPAARASNGSDERQVREGSSERRRGGVTRRDSLRAVGSAVALAGGVPGAVGARQGDESNGSDDDSASNDEGDEASGGPRDDFVWLGNNQWRDERLREEMLAFAREHGLAALYGQPPSNMPGVGDIVRPALEAAGEAGVDAWLNVGVLNDLTPEEFLGDADARERHLDGLREVAGVFDDLFDGGRLVLWQEAPVMGNWSETGEWNRETVRNLRRYGPKVFDAQRSAVREANPDLDVGTFVHFPYIVDSKQPEVFAEFADDLRERDAVPAFAFTDFYPGWYEKDVGLDPAADAVESLVANATEHLDRETYYMSQAHTINPGHTPSGQSLRAYLRAAVDGGAAGVGWYVSGNYTATEQGFDPLQPNPAGADFDGGPVATPTVSRDRYRYAWTPTLAARADVDPANRFDVWLRGDGFPFHAHRVEARTADGEWALLGHAGGYLDGDHPYARGETTAFRALARDRFLDGGTLELRIATDGGDEELEATPDGSAAAEGDDPDPTALDDVVVLPWDPDEFVSERGATALLDGDADLGPYALGRTAPDVTLAPGETHEVSVAIGDAIPSLTPLVTPGYTDAIYRLRAREENGALDPTGRFDLWLDGSGLDDPAAAPPLVDADGERVDPVAAAVAAVSTDEVALYYGLRRERFLDDHLTFGEGGTANVDRAFAMPCAGSACFRSPSRAATLVEDEPGEVATYAVTWTEP